MKNWTHAELLKLKGRRITCNIEGVFIKDAKIQVEGDKIYVCQNVKDGTDARDKLGYKYSWRISAGVDKYEKYNDYCTEIKLKPETLDDLEEGDFVIDLSGSKRKILGRAGSMCFLSFTDDFESHFLTMSTMEIKRAGYKLENTQEEPEITQMTVSEVAEKLGIDKDKLKIIAED